MSILRVSFLAFFMIVSFIACDQENEVAPAAPQTNQEIESTSNLRAANDEGPNGTGNSTIDCDSFKGLKEFKYRGYSFVDANTTHIDDIRNIRWTVAGKRVKPLNKKFVRLKDHLSAAATVEVCFRAYSPTCGAFLECMTVDFEPKK